ncbi:MAG: 4-hydroxy-3-methylbut-2-enyl diphosphate reductase [Verrucomicrobiaceae bacterium]
MPNNFVPQSARDERFEILLADHYGMCFGVRDAVSLAKETAQEGGVTILGELVHNAMVVGELQRSGATEGNLNDERAETPRVMITAHGASDRAKNRWRGMGHRVLDASCPLVRKAHTALATLVAEGCFPVVIGKAGHVEVDGLTGDFPEACVILDEGEIEGLPMAPVYGVVSQTTQPIEKVERLVACLRGMRPGSEVRFRDTVCQPTKNRQRALRELAGGVDLVIVVGGENSNNSRQLRDVARSLGCRSERIAGAEELRPEWLDGVSRVGVTAGTSTQKSCVDRVVEALELQGGRRAGK